MVTQNQPMISEATLADIMNKATAAGGPANASAAVSAEPEPSVKTNNEPSNPDDLDSAGTVYDPSIHTKSRAKRKNGEWKLRPNVAKRDGASGRPAPAAAAAPPNRPPQQMAPSGPSTLGGAPEGEGAPETDNAEAVAEMTLEACKAAARPIVKAAVGGHVVFLGKDWETDSKELDELVMATALYFYQTGQMVNMPPWMGLAVAYGYYAAPRFQRTSTRERIAGIFAPVARWWKSRRNEVKEAVESAKDKATEGASGAPGGFMKGGAFAGL
jgi:hypothetical protein